MQLPYNTYSYTIAIAYIAATNVILNKTRGNVAFLCKIINLNQRIKLVPPEETRRWGHLADNMRHLHFRYNTCSNE
jgi:hypothetical protein